MLVVALLSAAGCGGDPPSGDDDAGRDAMPDADAGPMVMQVEPPEMPMPPMAPRFADCEAGWARSGDGPCAPYPSATLDCADDEVHLPGTAACVRLGNACGANGTYSIDLPSGAPVRYVDANATAAGDGTRSSPHRSLSDAFDAAASGEILALAPGTYAGPFSVPPRVTVWGACVAGTKLTADRGEAAVLVTGAGVVLRSLSVVDSDAPGITAQGGTLTLRDVAILRAKTAALNAFAGGTIDADGISIRDTRPQADGGFGRGITIDDSIGTIAHAFIDANLELGVTVLGRTSRLTFSDSIVRGTESQPRDHSYGIGIDVSGATSTLTRVVVEGNRMIGISADGAGTSLTMSEVVVRGTRSAEADGHFGRALSVSGGATVDGTHLVLEDNQEAGMVIDSSGTEVTIRDSIVARNRPREDDGDLGSGAILRSGSHTVFERVQLVANHDIGVMVEGEGTRVELTDVVIEDTEPDVDLNTGRGMNVQEGAEVSVLRARIEGNQEMGVIAAQSLVSLEDVVVRNTTGRGTDRRFGRGIGVQADAKLTLRRVLLDDNMELALAVMDGATAMIEDLSVRGTMRQHVDDLGSSGILVHGAATVDATRIDIQQVRLIGVLTGEASTVTLREAHVDEVMPVDCDGEMCSGLHNFGIGVGSYFDGVTEVERFAISNADLCGVHVASDVNLRVGTVTSSAIGACVQVDGFDVQRLEEDVVYLDNAQNLDATELPIPNLDGLINR